MANRRSLARAPIAEAVVDFRARAHRPIDEAKARLAPELQARYPNVDEMRTFEAALAFRPGTPPVPRGEDKGLHGYVFKSEDGKDLAQFREDGFTVNRLSPYTGGDALAPDRVLTISIDQEGVLHYAGLFGDSKSYGAESFLGQVPPAIVGNLERLHSVASGSTTSPSTD